jgi:predicted RNA-binding protein YlqC (UPF0109 family)
MQELLTFIVKKIVTQPDDVLVTSFESEDGQQLTLRLSVNQEDMGLVIGREGNVARSLRNVLKVAALKQHQRVYLDILESQQVSEDQLAGEEVDTEANAD